MSQSLTVIC